MLQTGCKPATIVRLQEFSRGPGQLRLGVGHNVAGAVDNRKMDFRILGSFEVWVGDRLVGLGGEKPRALLAILLLHHDEVVSADRLIDDLWGETPPDSAVRTLQAYVSRLRKALGPNGASPVVEPESAFPANGGVLLTRGRGYLLEVAPGELDLDRFRDLVERGRDALAAGKDPPDLEDVGVLDRVERDLRVLLDDEHRHSLFLVERPDGPEQLADDSGSKAERRLVEHQNRRL